MVDLKRVIQNSYLEESGLFVVSELNVIEMHGLVNSRFRNLVTAIRILQS